MYYGEIKIHPGQTSMVQGPLTSVATTTGTDVGPQFLSDGAGRQLDLNH